VISYVIHQRLRQAPKEVYDFLVLHQPENHPRWEPEVLEFRREGPPVVGGTAIMVRKDFGKVSEQVVHYTELVPDRRVRFYSDDGSVRFDLAMDIEDLDTGSLLRGSVEITLRGKMRLLSPILARVFKKNSQTIFERFRALIDGSSSPISEAG